MILGAIGDDFTGSSDLGLMLAQGGMRTVQYVGVPASPARPDVQAGIVALKSRSNPATDAVRQSLEALAWLQAQGCTQFMFKYCSTFDSTPQGNIGPVIDALIDALQTDQPVIVCPAFPATGRSIYQGHLFVGDRLLSESGLQNHPLTPMTDPDIRRWLSHQTARQVGHLPLEVIRRGQAHDHLMTEAAAGRQIVVCDAVEDGDLIELAAASRGFALITGGSGIALGLPRIHNFSSDSTIDWIGETGPSLALSGSCSVATRDQIRQHKLAGGAQLKVEVADLLDGSQSIGKVLDWVLAQAGLPLVYTSDEPDEVRAVQDRFGGSVAAETVEAFFADLARAAVDTGIRRLICAGGETSGAIVTGLEADTLEIGPIIDPGVPAVRVTGRHLVLALKSGNFGAPDFFAKANAIMGAV